MKKKRKGVVAVVIVIAVLLLAVVGYNLYRYPARFHSQTDLSLDEAGTEQLRAQIAALGWTVTDTAQGPQLSKQ